MRSYWKRIKKLLEKYCGELSAGFGAVGVLLFLIVYLNYDSILRIIDPKLILGAAIFGLLFYGLAFFGIRKLEKQFNYEQIALTMSWLSTIVASIAVYAIL